MAQITNPNCDTVICTHCGATVTVYAAMEHAYCPECGISFRMQDAKSGRMDKELLDTLDGDDCYGLIKALPVGDAVALYETAADKGSYYAAVRLACWHYDNVRYDRAIALLDPYISGEASDAITLWCAASFYNCGQANPPLNELKKWRFLLDRAKEGLELLTPRFAASVADIIERTINRAGYRSGGDEGNISPAPATEL